MPIKVYLADKYSLFRKGLKYILENECNVRVVGEFHENRNLLDDIINLKPEVVIISRESYQFIPHIQEVDSNIKYIYIEDNNSSHELVNCDGYIMLNCEVEELSKVLDSFSGRRVSSLNVENNLTDREMQVLLLLAQGLSNKEIANKLSITERTTKNHISSILKKIHVNDRTQATLFAIKNNLVSV